MFLFISGLNWLFTHVALVHTYTDRNTHAHSTQQLTNLLVVPPKHLVLSLPFLLLLLYPSEFSIGLTCFGETVPNILPLSALSWMLQQGTPTHFL